MLPSVKNEDGARSKVPSKREEKKRINIRWNTTLFFQGGLVLVLLLSFLAMESDWSLGSGNEFSGKRDFDLMETGLLTYRLESPEVQTEVKIKKPAKQRILQKPVSQNFMPVDDTSKVPESNVSATEVRPDPPAIGTVAPDPKMNTGPSTYDTVQFVPIFPGCESLLNNAERKACMSEKVKTFINRKFKTDKFSDLETNKVHTINVLFTIGKDGAVKDIRARSIVPELEVEAERVISKMPWMQPGKQGSTPVDVLFSVPIRFNSQ